MAMAVDRYDPRIYWSERAKAQGPDYVGPGGRSDLTAVQGDQLDAAIGRVLPSVFPHSLILDFGCGSGRFASTLATYGRQYLGVDISNPGIEYAREVHPGLRFEWLETDRVPLEDGEVSLLVAITVFQHIVDPEDFDHWTKELRRVLAPDAPVLLVDTVFSSRVVSPHMCLRRPEEIASALGRDVRVSDGTANLWVGLLAPPLPL